jgi:ABC-type transport system involved in multi-copper enzyme maturation permease subunit
MIWLFSYFEDTRNLKHIITSTLFPLVIIAMTYLSIMTGNMFSGEIDKQTMGTLLTLPVKRWALYFGKILGMILIIPVIVLMPVGILVFELNIVVGYLPPVLISIILQLVLIIMLTFIAVISISALVSVILRKTLYSATAMFLYLMLMIFIIPILIGGGEPVTRYNVDYALIFLLPYACFSAATVSTIILNNVDPILYYLLTTYSLIAMVYGYLVFRRMEL